MQMTGKPSALSSCQSQVVVGPVSSPMRWAPTAFALRNVAIAKGSEDRFSGKTHAYTDFVFDASLDDSLFAIEPPAGYAVVRYEARPAVESDKSLVVSTEGIGDAKFAMTKEQAIAALGEPDYVKRWKSGAPGTNQTLETLVYDSRGFRIDVNSKHGVTSIRCESRYDDGSTVRDFPGKTEKGIGMGADWDDVEKAYGKSDSIPRMPQELRYEKIGLSFGFTGRKLTSIGAWRWSKDYDVWIIPAGNGFLSAGTAP